MTKSIAEARRASGTDSIAHSSVQAWSAGPIFPAVIAMVERYSECAPCFYSDGVPIPPLPLASRLETRWWELTLDGRTEQYATREDAELVAIGLLGDPELRAKWRGQDLDEHLFYLGDCVDAAGIPEGSPRDHLLYLAACERSIREGVAA